MQRERRTAWAVAGVAGAAALALRLWRLGHESLWVDEAFTWAVAGLPSGEIVRLQDQTPPLYNLLMAAWVAVAGSSEAALRLPSALLGAGAAALAAWMGARRIGPLAGTVAGLLCAFSFFLVRQGQTARAYALFTLLALASWLALLRLAERPSRGRCAAYAAVLAATLYSHAFALPLLAAHAAVAWARTREAPKARRRALWMQGAALGLFAPWLPVLLARAQAVVAGFWIHDSAWFTLRRVAGALATWYLGPAWNVVAGAAFLALALWGARAAWRAGGGARDLALAAWATAAALFALPFLAALLGLPLFVPAYASPLWPLVYLMAGAGVAALPVRWPPARGVAAAAVALVFAGNALLGFATPQNQDWRGAADALAAAGPDDLLILDAGYCVAPELALQCPLAYYGAPRIEAGAASEAYGRVDAPSAQAWAEAGRGRQVWLVRADSRDPDRLLPAELARTHDLGQALHLHKVELLRYVPRA